ncbi:MAG: tyrosine-type recombinase/integrase [Acetobacteraceae bacterium]
MKPEGDAAMPIRLTEPAIAKALRDSAATGARRDLADALQAGLRIRVTPNGTGTWVLACRDRAGRMRRFPLGRWPAMSISAARIEARALHHRVRYEGADPVEEARQERARGAAAKAGTVATLATLIDLYGRQRGAALRSWGDYQRSIGRVFGPFLLRPLAGLTAGDLQLAADRYAAVQQAALAVRCIRPILKWAAAPGRAYVGQDVTAITPPAPGQRRDRVLSREELARLLPVLRGSASPYAAAMRLMLLTLLRRSEADGARWKDVDWQAGTLAIAAERSKNRQPHVVPLSRQALALLRARLPAEADPEARIFATRTGGALPGWDKETKRLQAASGTAGWTRHDLRRTAATMLGESGESSDVIEAALNHVHIRSALAATYNRSRYRPQVAAALARLADALDGIEAGAAEVVALRRVTDGAG